MPERERQAWWVCLTSQRLSPYLETKDLCKSLAATAKPFRAFGRQPVRKRREGGRQGGGAMVA
jgi:hypothetical protein